VLRDKAKMAEWNSKNAPLGFAWAFPKQTRKSLEDVRRSGVGN